jgi:hypothetical protein
LFAFDITTFFTSRLFCRPNEKRSKVGISVKLLKYSWNRENACDTYCLQLTLFMEKLLLLHFSLGRQYCKGEINLDEFVWPVVLTPGLTVALQWMV